MIALLLPMLPLHIDRQDFPFPESFRTANMAQYIGCIRGEKKGSGDPDAPDIVHFAQVVSLCGEERLQWAGDLRFLIHTRHPDWTAEQVSKGVEFVISDCEIDVLTHAHNFQTYAIHDTPPPRF